MICKSEVRKRRFICHFYIPVMFVLDREVQLITSGRYMLAKQPGQHGLRYVYYCGSVNFINKKPVDIK